MKLCPFGHFSIKSKWPVWSSLQAPISDRSGSQIWFFLQKSATVLDFPSHCWHSCPMLMVLAAIGFIKPRKWDIFPPYRPIAILLSRGKLLKCMCEVRILCPSVLSFQVRAEAQSRSHMRSMSQSTYQPQSHHPDNSAMNVLYGYNTSPRKQQQQQYLQTQNSNGNGKSKKNSPFKDRFKLPNFSKFLDKAFGDDSRKTYQQYSHSTMSAPVNTPKRNLARRSMSHSGQHGYSSQQIPHFATAKRYSASGVPVKERAPLPPEMMAGGAGAGGQRERWSLCQCDPAPPPGSGVYQAETLSPKAGRSPCPKPTPSPRYSIHRYPLGMHNTHDDVTGKSSHHLHFVLRTLQLANFLFDLLKMVFKEHRERDVLSSWHQRFFPAWIPNEPRGTLGQSVKNKKTKNSFMSQTVLGDYFIPKLVIVLCQNSIDLFLPEMKLDFAILVSSVSWLCCIFEMKNCSDFGCCQKIVVGDVTIGRRFLFTRKWDLRDAESFLRSLSCVTFNQLKFYVQ